MYDFDLIKNNYTKLRNALIKYLEKFDDSAYYYKPTDKSNAVAWIVPHIVAFEKEKVMDFIEGYKFKTIMSDEDVAKYRPGVDGFAFSENELMTKDEAIKHLQLTLEISIKFLDDIINNADEIDNVDRDIVFARYMLNINHETEHYGQMKYLLGTHMRIHQ